MTTCNRFDHEFVFRQRQTVERLYEKELQDIVGPLIGHSSDGDSRRRKLNMLQLGTKNVGSRETYQDIVISCQFAVILICYMRDNLPEQECCLELSGSHVLEDFWSKNGQWVGNHHNYWFRDLQGNASHMI
ncbi:unnamed protein product [Porites lobata]|uniref:Uncharacterized protein n=1 Tax=Porites lobata TaxID=104759 RepID=A0ABN8P147_9CNID|nr:unnamed protein product [Porites lobata]